MENGDAGPEMYRIHRTGQVRFRLQMDLLYSVDRNQASKGMVMTKEKPKRCFTISHSHRRQRASGRS